MPKSLDDMNPREMREEIDRLSSAIQRARHCLEDGRRGDALQALKVACPRLSVRVEPTDPKPKGAA